MKLRKGDRVRVISGKDVGKEGEITRVLPQAERVIVDGVNIAKRHTRAQGQTMQGGIIDKEMPLDASNVGLVCDKCHKPTRIGYRFEAGRKIRVCRKCGGDV